MHMNPIAKFIKTKRREAGLTQGKPSVRMDKVNVALGMFGMEAGPVKKVRDKTSALDDLEEQ